MKIYKKEQIPTYLAEIEKLSNIFVKQELTSSFICNDDTSKIPSSNGDNNIASDCSCVAKTYTSSGLDSKIDEHCSTPTYINNGNENCSTPTYINNKSVDDIERYISHFSIYASDYFVTKQENGFYLFLFKSYNPFKINYQTAYIDSYYFASHKLYLNTKKITAYLSLNNINATANHTLPYKQILAKCGFNQLKNTLLCHPDFGSYFVISLIEIENFCLSDLSKEDVSLAEKNTGIANFHSEFFGFLNRMAKAPKPMQATSICCDDCTLCIDACPNSAIKENGFVRKNCLREFMENGVVTDEIAKKLSNKLLGCDICQRVCPQNNAEQVSMSWELTELLRQENVVEILIKNDTDSIKKIRSLIGTNYFRKAKTLPFAENALKNKELQVD